MEPHVSDRLDIEIVPTVTLGSAISCVSIVNMFLRANDQYRLIWSDGKYVLTDDTKMGGGAR